MFHLSRLEVWSAVCRIPLRRIDLPQSQFGRPHSRYNVTDEKQTRAGEHLTKHTHTHTGHGHYSVCVVGTVTGTRWGKRGVRAQRHGKDKTENPSPKEFLFFLFPWYINSPAIVLFSTYRKFGGQNGQQDEVNPLYLKAVYLSAFWYRNVCFFFFSTGDQNSWRLISLFGGYQIPITKMSQNRWCGYVRGLLYRGERKDCVIRAVLPGRYKNIKVMTDTRMFSKHFAYKWHRIDLGAMKSKSKIPAVPPNNPSFSVCILFLFYFLLRIFDWQFYWIF